MNSVSQGMAMANTGVNAALVVGAPSLILMTGGVAASDLVPMVWSAAVNSPGGAIEFYEAFGTPTFPAPSVWGLAGFGAGTATIAYVNWRLDH
jgi:hypothetical protein